MTIRLVFGSSGWPRIPGRLRWRKGGWLSSAGLAVAIALAGAAPAAAETWEAASTTAQSITGNVTFVDTRITFGNKASLQIEKMSVLDGFIVDGRKLRATLYRAVTPANLVLLHGNALCGGGRHVEPATYLVVWHPDPIGGDAAPRSMAVFSGQAVPTSQGSPNLCGVYNYESTKP